MNLDLNYIRNQFPVFNTDDAKEWAFFDNAGGSFAAKPVVQILNDFYTKYKVQPYGPNPLGQKAGEAMDRGRYVMAKLMDVSKDQLTIGPSSTQNLNTLAVAFSEIMNEGDEVIISEQDHEANIGGWDRLCKRANLKLKIWEVDEDGELTLENLNACISPKTKLVCMTQTSNIIGTVNPINEVYNIINPKGIKLVVDSVSFVPHCWPNLNEINCDAYIFSTYKTYGPHQSVMVVGEELMEILEKQCHFFNHHYKYKWFDSAGPDHASVAALAGIGDYFEQAHKHHFGESDDGLFEKTLAISKLMGEHETQMGNILLNSIKDLPIKLHGKKTMEGRKANFSFSSSRHSSKDLMNHLSNHKIVAKQGHFYAYRLLKKLQFENLDDGIMRISLSHYNTKEEINRLVKGLESLF